MVERTTSVARKRYGQIFISSDDTFAFMCEVCATDFFTIEEFRVHLAEHFPKVSTNSKNDVSFSSDSDCEQPDEIMDFEAIQEFEAARSQSITEPFGSSMLDADLDDSEYEKPKRKQTNYIYENPPSYNRNAETKLKKLESYDRRSFVCRYCCKIFSAKSNRDDHENTHTGIRPFQCTICSSTFASRNCLRGHIKTHTDDRQHQCSVCKKRFTRKSYLNIHTRERHLPDSDPRSYFACKVCDLKFETYDKIKRHRLIHRNSTMSNSSVIAL